MVARMVRDHEAASSSLATSTTIARLKINAAGARVSLADGLRSGIEVVITGLTRNQVARKGSWVRIPPAPPRAPAFELAGVFLCYKVHLHVQVYLKCQNRYWAVKFSLVYSKYFVQVKKEIPTVVCFVGISSIRVVTYILFCRYKTPLCL